MSLPSVIVLGGGLAGLCVATELQRRGVAWRLVEARPTLGGRILTVERGVDLGPSWIWPDVQPRVTALVRDLGLSTFPQYSDGDVVFHRMSREAPQRYRAQTSVTGAERIVGGTGALVESLGDRLPADRVHLGTPVSRLERTDSGVRVGEWEVDCVVAALPPRLLADAVSFDPPLPHETVRRWRETPTWMAPHAKFFALYDRPFWREAGLSGAAQSMVGPLVEVHDATTASGDAALFGFVGVPFAERQRMGRARLEAAALDQLALLFGPEAREPRATLYKDWAEDRFTATGADGIATGHLTAQTPPWVTGPWADALVLAGSETSEVDPGYLEGAVDAATRAVAELSPS